MAQCIVDTVREPLLVLDKGLRVIAASRSFYSAFKVSPQDTQGRLLYALGDGQWNIPSLRVLLEQILPKPNFEGWTFDSVGKRCKCWVSVPAFDFVVLNDLDVRRALS